MAVKKPENLSFEQAMSELNNIVTDMENGELSLEQSLKHFERGVQLANASSAKLNQAEQKVQILMGNDTSSALTSFDSEAE
ncbi:exodeoxyribonuclease VII small subunit [Pseudoalteromonas denitrificans]|jgi:exodeoxyribonuclease VII small subunit|uniref:Exodeoxyribonuclease 7 small subunit n=1 Tax=Pseudoalteromonas denitrificans DSM 6059 TaxID=1123010 RepID=A0A1I1LFM7_9GAMM|nr:exodeoxyribonuclease VII small subunit [Pseudoalteromonas denitrificans]SFC69818.1 Exodeoxyribonuclease VII small subunit [Pseudoalteromonas denitrificans DSM 6059]